MTPQSSYRNTFFYMQGFKKVNDEKMIDLVLKYAENGHSIHAVKIMNLKFPKVSNKEDIAEKFAFHSLQTIKSLEKTQRPKDIAFYVTKACHFQFESTDDIIDIIAKTSSWFNIKVLKNVINRFGSNKDKTVLSNYE